MKNLSLPMRRGAFRTAVSAVFVFTLCAAVLAGWSYHRPAAEHEHFNSAGHLTQSKIDPARGLADLIINEADSDTPGSDVAEFIELYDGGAGNTPLDGFVVVLYNGSTDLSYAAFDLDGFTTNASGFFTLGNATVTGVDLVFANGLIQNGQDAIGIYAASATSFPNNTPVTVTNLVDAIVYDNGQADDAGLLVLLNGGQPQINENGSATGTTVSMQRCPSGSGGMRNTNTYAVFAPTPDVPNACGAGDTIQFGSATYLEDESQILAVTVTRNGTGTNTSTVDFVVTGGSATPGLCVAGGDYEGQNGTLTFNPTDNAEVINISICPDLLKEAPETFTITLSNPTNAGLGSPSVATATIFDAAAQFVNPIAIPITDGVVTSTPLNVSGGGPIGNMRVTLFDITDDVANDLNVVLLGPSGQSFVLLADAGGANPLSTSTTLTFYDNSPAYLPETAQITAGSFKPTSWSPGPTVLPVGPPPNLPYAESGPGGGRSQVYMNIVYGGLGSDGVWTLFVYADNGAHRSAAPGSIAGGWGLEVLAPTAVQLSLAGRVFDSLGYGIRNATITLQGGGISEPRSAVTGSFGHYSFEGLTTGTYMITVRAKQHTFAAPSRIIALSDNVTDADFVAEPLE